MMRHCLFLIAVLTLVSLTSVHADPPKNDLAAIQGAWNVVDLTLSGKAVPENERQGVQIVFTDSKLSIQGVGGGDTKRVFTVKLDPTKKPKALDYTALEGPFKDKTNFGIYELNGDELKLCLHNADATEYPTEFKSVDGDMLGVFVLRRVKP